MEVRFVTEFKEKSTIENPEKRQEALAELGYIYFESETYARLLATKKQLESYEVEMKRVGLPPNTEEFYKECDNRLKSLEDQFNLILGDKEKLQGGNHELEEMYSDKAKKFYERFQKSETKATNK